MQAFLSRCLGSRQLHRLLLKMNLLYLTGMKPAPAEYTRWKRVRVFARS